MYDGYQVHQWGMYLQIFRDGRRKRQNRQDGGGDTDAPDYRPGQSYSWWIFVKLYMLRMIRPGYSLWCSC